jgi:hypothetical protein
MPTPPIDSSNAASSISVTVAPVAPVAPVGPAGPTAPVAPVAPVGPAGPAGPIAPVAPVAPVGPTGPCGPGGPVGPAAPCGPTAPFVTSIMPVPTCSKNDPAASSAGKSATIRVLLFAFAPVPRGSRGMRTSAQPRGGLRRRHRVAARSHTSSARRSAWSSLRAATGNMESTWDSEGPAGPYPANQVPPPRHAPR